MVGREGGEEEVGEGEGEEGETTRGGGWELWIFALARGEALRCSEFEEEGGRLVRRGWVVLGKGGEEEEERH